MCNLESHLSINKLFHFPINHSLYQEYTPVRMAIINKSKTSAGEDVEKEEPLCTVGGNADWCSHCGKQYGDTSKN